MALITFTRRYEFRSVHSLHIGQHKERLHGHQYFLEVSFKDRSIEDVDRLVRERVLLPLHGRNLTGLVEPATGENLVEWIDGCLRNGAGLQGDLRAVALQETRKNRFVSAKSEVRFV